MKLPIRVTKADIRNGAKLSSTDCPIALALRRKFPSAYIRVCEEKIFIYDGLHSRYRYWLSPKLSDFIDDFDYGGPAVVKPFIFDLGRLRPVIPKTDEDDWNAPEDETIEAE